MKSKFWFFLIIAVFSVNTVSAQGIVKYIPADASMVLTVHPKNIDDKISLDKLQKFDFYNSMLQMMSESFKSDNKDMVYEALQDPAKQGMNFMRDYFFFIQAKDGITMMNYLYELSDEAKFSSFVQKLSDEQGVSITDKKSYKVIYLNSTSIVWNNEMALFTLASATVNPDDYSFEEEEQEVTFEDQEVEEAIEEEVVMEDQEVEDDGEMDMEAFLEQMQKEEEAKAKFKTEKEKAAIMEGIPKLMYGKGTNSLTQNVSFMKSFAAKHDANLWMDYEKYMENQMGNVPNMEDYSEKFASLYKGSKMSMDFDFNDGKMDMASTYTSSPENSKKWAGMMNNSFNKRFVKYIKGDNLMALFGMSYKFEEGVKLMQEMFGGPGMDVGQMASEQLMAMGVNIEADNLYKMFKGDMVFAVTGMRSFEKMVTKTDYDEDFNKIETETMSKQTLPEFVMMMTYNNESDLNKFITAGKDMSMLVDKGGYFNMMVPNMPMDVHVAMNKGILFVTNDLDLVTKNLKKGFSKSKRASKSHCKALKSNAGIMFWDMDKTISSVEGMEEMAYLPASAKKTMKATKDTFEQMYFNSTFDESNNFTSKGAISFKNNKMNALEQLFNYINEVYFHSIGGTSM